MQWNEKFDYGGAQLYVLYHAYVKIPLLGFWLYVLL